MRPTPSDQQVAAIEEPGVVFVSAGAGTGKTTVLVERFVKAVCERGLGIDNVELRRFCSLRNAMKLNPANGFADMARRNACWNWHR